MKTGDKVRFLNEVGGGVVVGFPDKNQVLVRDASGFDIPMLRHDVVVIESSEGVAENVESEAIAAKTHVLHRTDTSVTHGHASLRDQEEQQLINFHLAYVRDLDARHGEQRYDAYLINDSPYYAQFVLSEKDAAGVFVRHSDMIEPNTKLFLESFGEHLVSTQENLVLQALFFKPQTSFLPKAPVSVNIKTDPVKFVKMNTFKRNDFFTEPALIIDLVIDDEAVKPLEVEADRLKEAMADEKRRQDAMPIKRRPAREKLANGPLEIDLHADELLDTTHGMSAKDILDYQLQVFRNTLNEHIRHKGKKIVFIHGKGNGVLRKEIENELKRHYKSCRFQDASFQEYGFGATLVTI